MDTYVSPNLTMTAYALRTVGERKVDSRNSESLDGTDSYLSFFGIFDGHHGDEASQFAKTHLQNHITAQEEFWADDDASIISAIKKGFVSCQDAMWQASFKWKRTSSDFPSMSGTSACIVIFTRGKIFAAHVGDSKIIFGYQHPNSQHWIGHQMTTVHRPGDPKELAQIEAAGGKVRCAKGGFAKVVWRKPKTEHTGCVTRSGPIFIEEVPFLHVSRSLGDFWSYNFQKRAHIVSPVPDVFCCKIEKNCRCVILGNDALWKLVSPQDAVYIVGTAIGQIQVPDSEESDDNDHVSSASNLTIPCPAKNLVEYGVRRLVSHSIFPENISAVTVVIEHIKTS